MKKPALLAVFAVFCLCLTSRADETIPPIPGLSSWEENMLDNSRVIAAQPSEADCGKISEGFIWYYDGIFIFHQIAEYTKDKSWLKVAEKCRKFYRDGYVINCKKNSADGWRNFTRGLYYDWTVLNDETSKKTAIEMARKSKFSQIVHSAQIRRWDKNVDVSREVAYSINAWHVAKDLGASEFSGRDPYLDTAFSHLDIWKAYLTSYPNGAYPGEQTAKFQPFMFGLTAEALIRVYERPETSAEDRAKIFVKIYDLAKLTYDKLYNDSKHGFMANTGKPNMFWGNIDLLTVPLYGWLWHVTGEKYFLDAGDKIWKNWVDFGWQEISGWGGKQFSQNYHWSFDYVRWRSQAPKPDPKALEMRTAKSEAVLNKLVSFPNPFKLIGGIVFTIDRILPDCEVDITNSAGVKVRALNSQKKSFVEWDGKDEKKEFVPEGSYTFTVRAKDGAEKTGKVEVK
ncbi:MAG: FlgD immunoglobulin-like domain containing protein [Candidatus Firestonebacteria bacterium]